jgi:sulfur-oxidizing protein SoxZ
VAKDTIKGRVELRADGIARVRLLIKHPMSLETRDAQTGAVVAAHFIEELACTLKDEVLMSSDLGQAVSANPYVEFHFKGAQKGDKLVVRWKDNKGDTDQAELTVG